MAPVGQSDRLLRASEGSEVSSERARVSVRERVEDALYRPSCETLNGGVDAAQEDRRGVVEIVLKRVGAEARSRSCARSAARRVAARLHRCRPRQELDVEARPSPWSCRAGWAKGRRVGPARARSGEERNGDGGELAVGSDGDVLRDASRVKSASACACSAGPDGHSWRGGARGTGRRRKAGRRRLSSPCGAARAGARA